MLLMLCQCVAELPELAELFGRYLEDHGHHYLDVSPTRSPLRHERLHLVARQPDGRPAALMVIRPEDWLVDVLYGVGPARQNMLALMLCLRFIDANRLGIAFDETVKRGNLEALWRVFATKAEQALDIEALDAQVEDCVPEDLRRASGFLDHPVFQLYHAETEMMRYMRALADRDLALDRCMIPLGSCTMKLNAAAEMIPVTWPGHLLR